MLDLLINSGLIVSIKI